MSRAAVHLVIGRMIDDSEGMDPDGVAAALGLTVPEGLQCLGSGGCFVGVPVRVVLRDGLGPCRAEGLVEGLNGPDAAEARRLCAALSTEWAAHQRLGPLGAWLMLARD